jgi:hypothetical protein
VPFAARLPAASVQRYQIFRYGFLNMFGSRMERSGDRNLRLRFEIRNGRRIGERTGLTSGLRTGEMKGLNGRASVHFSPTTRSPDQARQPPHDQVTGEPKRSLHPIPIGN